MSAITIRLAWPYKELSPNYSNKKNIHGIAAAKRQYRWDCHVDARGARDCRTEYPLKAPVEATAIFVVPKGPMPDGDNALASIKIAIDGIADAGILANDRDIVSWQVSVERGVKREVVILLRERTDE